MEKKDKIIIAVLIAVVIALIGGLAYMMMGNISAGGDVPDGMQKYNFDSAFTMNVPKDAKFLKNFNSSMEGFGQGVSYFDKNHEFAVSYINSPLLSHELVSYFEKILNESGNATFEHDGDLLISHNLKNNGKIGKDRENSNFTETVLVQRGHEIVSVEGNDADLIKSMIQTLEWYE